MSSRHINDFFAKNLTEISGQTWVQDQSGFSSLSGCDLEPGVVHEDEVVLEPVDGSLGLRGHQATKGQGLALAQGNVLSLFPVREAKTGMVSRANTFVKQFA